MRPKIAVILLLLTAFLLTARGGFLIWRNWQHDLRLQLAKHDLESFWQIEIQRLWGNQEQAEQEHRQEIVNLTNEQRQVVNERQNEIYPLLKLEIHQLLEQSAREAFDKIAKTKKFEHQDLSALLAKGGPFDRVGENLAAEVNVNPVRTVYDFYLSDTHREVMLRDWEYIGVWSGWVEGLVIEDKEPQNFYVTVVHFGE